MEWINVNTTSVDAKHCWILNGDPNSCQARDCVIFF